LKIVRKAKMIGLVCSDRRGKHVGFDRGRN